MGMFDNISVSDSLPVNQEMIDCGMDINNHSFQTKSLNCCMSTYYIQGGKLLQEKYKINEWTEGAGGYGFMNHKEPYLVDIAYHGKINFYDFQSKENWDYWVEYEATFTHGTLEKIELQKFKRTDKTSKNDKIRALLEAGRVSNNKWYNKYLFSTVAWRFVRNKLCTCLHWLEQKSQWLRINLP